MPVNKKTTDIFIVIGLMLTGMLLGYLLRRKNLYRIRNVITVLIWVLFFTLGIEVDEDEQIVKGLHTMGTEAIILTLGGTLGSIIATWTLWKALYKKRGEAA